MRSGANGGVYSVSYLRGDRNGHPLPRGGDLPPRCRFRWGTESVPIAVADVCYTKSAKKVG